MDSMQNEAMRRVRAMQGAVPTGRAENPTPKNTNEPLRAIPVAESKEKPEDRPNNGLKSSVAEKSQRAELQSLFKDKEKLLILLLIMLLGSDRENPELVLALLYIII